MPEAGRAIIQDQVAIDGEAFLGPIGVHSRNSC